MYKTPKNETYLQLFLRQPDVENPAAADLPGCGQKCTIEKFYEKFNYLIPGTFEDECGVKKPDPTTENPPLTTTEKPNSAAINGNSQLLSIVICSFWVACKLILQ